MCRHYRKPILLIEFDNSRAFAMNSASDITSEISNSSIISKISLLCIHFPALRVLWSRDPDMTADMFHALKQLFDEPDEAAAMAAGARCSVLRFGLCVVTAPRCRCQQHAAGQRPRLGLHAHGCAARAAGRD